MSRPEPTFIRTSQGFINLAFVAQVAELKNHVIIKLACNDNGQATNIWLDGAEAQAFIEEIERYTISLTNS
ncbi:hypothetical protein NG798_27675 [Ancylothrix sp. C2]|uniref:hypothetical protein n=1 Tax=Ancylothrix sp. D3o TaxID=2953691 RepID=UPI0021BA5462|nr:hypothetical protein [Ancylothrix sp. D3o]MCT7953581.1 hypothetical protein [Ancylothrix sp. D3o]